MSAGILTDSVNEPRKGLLNELPTRPELVDDPAPAVRAARLKKKETPDR
jgi:hypothetical protein